MHALSILFLIQISVYPDSYYSGFLLAHSSSDPGVQVTLSPRESGFGVATTLSSAPNVYPW